MHKRCDEQLACTSWSAMSSSSIIDKSVTENSASRKHRINLSRTFDFEIAREFLTARSFTRENVNKSPRPIYDVFLGGSCGNTVWRRSLVIPYLEKRGITYYDPQRSVWNEHMINEESVAKENSNLFLFVIDPATINATSFLEIAHFSARKAPKLVVVFLNQCKWKDKAHPEDLSDRHRTCDLLDNILAMHNVPVLHSIQDALTLIDEVVIGEKKWSEAMSDPLQRLPYMLIRGKCICRQSACCVVNTWRSIINSIVNWKGTKFVLLGLCEFFIFFAVHFFFYIYSVVILAVAMFSFDLLLALLVVIYHQYKVRAEMKRHAKLLEMQHHASVRLTPLPIPGRALVPCEIVSQRIPLNYCYKINGGTCFKEAAIISRLAKSQSYNSNSIANPLHWMNNDYGFDVFLGSSSRSQIDLAWINHLAAPQLHRRGLSFCSELMVERHRRRNVLRTSKYILYHVPSYETMLSGMVEIAYLLGDMTKKITICVPKRAEVLESSLSDSDEIKLHISKRNESYRMAFCYLREMAERRGCEVFSELEDALHYVLSCSKKGE